MSWCDTTPTVLRWASEEQAILYKSPLDNKLHRYFPDFLIEVAKDGRKEMIVVEIKPFEFTQPPKPGKNKRRFMRESMEYAKNLAKWAAARYWCDNRGYKFQILTEKEIFGERLP